MIDREADLIVLVDSQDVEIGVGEKLDVHKAGLLHRAVSVFLFDPAGHVLLQRRAARKYHSGGLWSNTACSHPLQGESTLNAAKRRLREEMGLQVKLDWAFATQYRLQLAGGLTEHELDHVFVGYRRLLTRLNLQPRPLARQRRTAHLKRWLWTGAAAGDLKTAV